VVGNTAILWVFHELVPTRFTQLFGFAVMGRAIFDNLVIVALGTLHRDSPLIFFMQCTTASLWYAGLPDNLAPNT
jgi:hypothetical protein